MSGPPRMLYLIYKGLEALVNLPVTIDKALAAAYERFSINMGTYEVRLSCPASEMPWIGAFASGQNIFVGDAEAYNYACAGKTVVRLNVHLFDKNDKDLQWAEPDRRKGNPVTSSAGGATTGAGAGGAATAPAPAANKQAEVSLYCETGPGKSSTLKATVSGDLAKGPAPGNYLGTLTIESGSLKQNFVGKQLGPNERFVKYIAHDKATARLLFRPRSIKPHVNFLYPEAVSLEVSYYLSDWQVLTAYPITNLVSAEEGKTRLRWFLRVLPGGAVGDLMTGVETSSLFAELLPNPKAVPNEPDPQAPLNPAWPDVRPQNGWCLPREVFIPHMDRVLRSLGVPVESRTSMITSWLPSLMRHKNIGYRLLNADQLAPTMQLVIIPPPHILTRIFVLFKGVPDGQLKDWEGRGRVQTEMGLDWRDAWNENILNEDLFRVIEYGFMEVNEA